MIEWIVFDLGGVVVKHDAARVHTAFAQLLDNQTGTLRELLEERLMKQLAIGAVKADEAVAVIHDHLKHRISQEEIVAALNAELFGEFAEVIEYIDQLKARYRIACLSNTNPLHWEVMSTGYEVFSRFELALASHLLEAAKPDATIYHRALEALSADPSSCVFIDDRVENAEAATRLGWHGYHYTDLNQLKSDLALIGIM